MEYFTSAQDLKWKAGQNFLLFWTLTWTSQKKDQDRYRSRYRYRCLYRQIDS